MEIIEQVAERDSCLQIVDDDSFNFGRVTVKPFRAWRRKGECVVLNSQTPWSVSSASLALYPYLHRLTVFRRLSLTS